MHKAKREEHVKRPSKDAETRTVTVAATIRWAQVLPVDFDGEDTSLTQAQLAILK